MRLVEVSDRLGFRNRVTNVSLEGGYPMIVYRISALLGVLFLPLPAFGHHSIGATFDSETIIELEGEITQVLWRNPHVRFTISARNESGQEALWQVESQSVSTLRRKNVTTVLVAVGDKVRVAGNPSRRTVNEMHASNMLLPSGREVVLRGTGKPRWTEQALGTSGPGFANAGDTSEPARGIFRVWSTVFSAPMLLPEISASFDLYSYPLTDTARAAVAAFDPAEDSPIGNCEAKGMPTIMEQPFPMEFTEQGENILLSLEEYDLVRTIHMGTGTPLEEQPASLLGYSAGQWNGSTLVVTTTGVNWPHFDTVGIPLSGAVEIIERFTPTEDGSRLDYGMTVTDPATFTEPVALEKYWLWLPDIEVGRYECTVDG